MLTPAQFANTVSETRCYVETKRGKTYLVTVFGNSTRKPQREAVSDLDKQRVRFNWGYWNARSDVKESRMYRNMSTHFDRAYAAGYVAGLTDNDPASSEPAWSRSGRENNYEGWR